MCRHFAYVGERVSMKSVLYDPPHSLIEQAWSPRLQRHGTMNVDGFGVGWYADGDRIPARYRRAGPIWADDDLRDLARVTRTRAMLCAVRSASVGTDAGAAAAAPFTDGRWLFSLNGALVGWSAAAGGSTTPRRSTAALPGVGPSLAEAAAAVLKVAAGLPAADLLGLQARCDTALVWAVVLGRLRAGDRPASALARTIASIRAAGGTGRFNLLLTDGEMIAATAAGDSLYYGRDPRHVIVASEPFDDEPTWQEIPDGSVVEATTARVIVRPLADAASAATAPHHSGNGALR
jgi:gamma-glutamyl hercynylcysteine S-oxide hydrolase